jgi:hypothetical protein
VVNAIDDAGPFFHGTKAALEPGASIEPGFGSNFGDRTANWVYFTATLDAATWGAELALGDAPGRIYIVEPTGAWENDPNLTDTGSRETRLGRIARSRRCGWWVRFTTGSRMRPKCSDRCATTSRS